MKRSSRITAILLALMLTVCMMPTFAFADDVVPEEGNKETAEEVKEETEEVTEETKEEIVETIVGETEEEVVEEETAELAEETAELEDKYDDVSASVTWDGYKAKITTTGDFYKTYSIRVSGEEKMAGLLTDGVIDVESVVKEAFKNNDICQVEIRLDRDKEVSESAVVVYRSMGSYFYNIAAKAVVGDVATKDVHFKYGVESIVGPNEKGQYKGTDNKTDSEYLIKIDMKRELIEDSLVVKKGTSEGTGNLVLRLDVIENIVAPLAKSPKRLYIPVIKEVSNDGGYTTDPTLWTAFPEDYITDLEPTANTEEARTMKLKNVTLKGFNNSSDELTATLNKYYKDSYATGDEEALKKLDAELLAKINAGMADEMTFVHGKAPVEKKKSHKKGVQTGDESGLMIWLTMFAIAGAAAGAVALKRK